MNNSLNFVEGLLAKNLIRCPLMDNFMKTMAINLASRKIFIMNGAKLGSAEDATATAQDAIQKACTGCVTRAIHHATADAYPPFEKTEQTDQSPGLFEPTIIIHAM